MADDVSAYDKISAARTSEEADAVLVERYKQAADEHRIHEPGTQET